MHIFDFDYHGQGRVRVFLDDNNKYWFVLKDIYNKLDFFLDIKTVIKLFTKDYLKCTIKKYNNIEYDTRFKPVKGDFISANVVEKLSKFKVNQI